MGGGWVGVKTWILVLSFKPKLNNFPMYIYKNLFLFYNLDFRIVSFIKKKEKRERYIFQISKASIKFWKALLIVWVLSKAYVSLSIAPMSEFWQRKLTAEINLCWQSDLDCGGGGEITVSEGLHISYS